MDELTKNAPTFWKRLHDRTKMTIMMLERNVIKPGTSRVMTKSKGGAAPTAETELPPIDDYTLKMIIDGIYQTHKLMEAPRYTDVGAPIEKRFPGFFSNKEQMDEFIASSEKIIHQVALERQQEDES